MNTAKKSNILRQIPILFAIVTLSIFMVPQLAIDLYLPGLPQMKNALNTSKYITQISLTTYILAMGLSQLIYGPLSDKYGRKPIIILGTFIFFMGSLFVSISQTGGSMLIGRGLQGIGMGASFTVASAILGDSFEGKQLAFMMTLSSMVYALSPLLAPTLGGFLTQFFGWRMNFYFMAAISIILLLAIFIFIPETNHQKNQNAIKLTHLVKNYLLMLTHIQFVFYTTCLTTAFGITIAFNVIGPFLLQTILSVTPFYYGILLLFLGGAYLLGTSANSVSLKWFTIPSLIGFGLGLMVAGCMALGLSHFIDWFSPISVILWTSLIIFGTGFVFPNCLSLALEVFPNNLGSASALIGSCGLIGTSIISNIIAHFTINNELKLFVIFAMLTLLSLGSFLTICLSFNKKD